ncbi:MAG: hypothetical protein KTR31_36725 [Myxococcales bacterium]|nr:hypothetical protein [Myxococcales bacterium]
MFVFDFDGVLFDTARECLAIAWETSLTLPFAASWRDLPGPPPDVEAAFLAHRYWVGPPWQYAVLLRSIAQGDLPTDTQDFDRRAEAQREALAGFTEAYFATRERLSADPDRWCATVRAHRGPTAAFLDLHRTGQAMVLSTRDDRSIRLLLHRFLDVDDAVLLERGGPRPKWQILADLAAQRGLAPARLFFIDDHPHHALPAHEHGFASHLALWGYNAPDDVAACRAAGLSILAMDELDAAIAAHHPGATQ